MKKTIFSLLFSAITLISSAQITVTLADFASIGDTLEFYNDTNVSGLNIGGSGLQSWDFSGLDINAVFANYVVDPVSTPLGSAFPTADYANDQGEVDSYISANSSKAEIIGYAGDPFGFGFVTDITFSDPQTLVDFPMNYNSSAIDTMRFEKAIDAALIFGPNPPLDSIKVIRTSTQTDTVDAYGTLITATDTIDALRRYRSIHSIDSIFGFIFNQWSLISPIPGVLDENPRITDEAMYDWFGNNMNFNVVTVRLDSNLAPKNATVLIGNGLILAHKSTTQPNCNNTCTGSIEVEAYGAGNAYTYQWDSNAGSQTNSTAGGLCANTPYQVTVTNNLGQQFSQTVEITQQPEAINLANYQSNDEHCPGCSDGSITAINIQGGIAPYSYLWSNGATTANINSLIAGNYTLTVTDNNGCQSDFTISIGQWLTGISSNSEQNGINIYPNPSSGEKGIHIASKESISEISLYNTIGNRVFFNQNIDLKTFSIPTESIEPGVYFIMINHGKTKGYTKKIVLY